ncbi:CopG family transcriptional regulator [Roseateles sp.]|uniref:ribbon-helix-helix domain-containing protein n=1 Tax=Roseateles sp. TaxID=1971397 RepID=UPI00286A8792|nr:CopG family transcriptional regulator [Roseateles sp.]
MRTTLDIEDDLLLAAKELARREGASAGAIVSRLLRRSLTGLDATPASSKSSHGLVDASNCGFEPFAAKPGVVTSLDEVNALREAEGI